MIVASALWRRLDTPGHDACRLEQGATGWALDGAAVFSEDGSPAQLAYRIACDLAWRTQHGEVRGWLGGRAVEFSVSRTSEGLWTLNGVLVPRLEGCVDLDLGFTPATNLTQIRRSALAVGQAAHVPVAWRSAMSGGTRRPTGTRPRGSTTRRCSRSGRPASSNAIQACGRRRVEASHEDEKWIGSIA
jgi:hypothetical protein